MGRALKFLTYVYKSGNTWQSLLAIGNATYEITRGKTKETSAKQNGRTATTKILFNLHRTLITAVEY